jgi:hypothetical protein
MLSNLYEILEVNRNWKQIGEMFVFSEKNDNLFPFTCALEYGN